MRLETGVGEYIAHFCHNQKDGRRWTTAAVHIGPCVMSNGRGCVIREGLMVGLAYCAPQDQFVRRVGRKRSLARAISRLPEDVRTMLWESYFKLVPKK